MRGFGSLNFASKTFLAAARSADRGSASRGACGRGDGAACDAGCAAAEYPGDALSPRDAGSLTARSSLTISSGCEMSGSSGRVTTRVLSAAGSPSRRNSPAAPAESPRARFCASSFAFSAFFSASRRRLMSAQRLARRPDGRSDAARVRLRKEVTAWKLVPEPAEVAVGAGIADHAGAQKDDQLRLPRQVAARRERLADERDAAYAGNSGVRVLHLVLHQACQHCGFAALQPEDRIELARLEQGDVVLGRRALQRRIGIAGAADLPADGRPHVEHDAIG